MSLMLLIAQVRLVCSIKLMLQVSVLSIRGCTTSCVKYICT